MNEAPGENPFAAPNGAIPTYYQPRPALGGLNEFRDVVAHGATPESISLIGPRGCGKSVELARTHDALLNDGVQVLSVLLSESANAELDAFLVAALDGLFEVGSSRERPVKTTVRAGIPWFSIEGEFGPRAPETKDFCERVTELLDPSRSSRPTGVVVLIDEGDFLSARGFDNGLQPVLNRASRSDQFPFGVVATGCGWDFDRAMRGKGSYARDVIRTVPVERLSPEESQTLLVETAKRGGQSWTPEELSPLVEVCQGVPRLLHFAGRRLFAEWGSNDRASAVRAVANSTKGSRDHARSLMPMAAYRALDLLTSVMGDKQWSSRELRQAIARLSQTEDFDKLDKAVNTLFTHGYLEYRGDLTVALAQH